MRKKDELTNPLSCMSRAREDEMTFVLLGRDVAAPTAIRAWIEERIRVGKNQPGDPQTIEAEACAATMEREYWHEKNMRRIALAEWKSRAMLTDLESAEFDRLQKEFFAHLDVLYPRKSTRLISGLPREPTPEPQPEETP